MKKIIRYKYTPEFNYLEAMKWLELEFLDFLQHQPWPKAFVWTLKRHLSIRTAIFIFTVLVFSFPKNLLFPCVFNLWACKYQLYNLYSDFKYAEAILLGFGAGPTSVRPRATVEKKFLGYSSSTTTFWLLISHLEPHALLLSNNFVGSEFWCPTVWPLCTSVDKFL